jgi:hypothetical protein
MPVRISGVWQTAIASTCAYSNGAKLLGDKNGKHYWGKVVTDPASFEAGLLRHLGMNETEFQKEIKIIRRHRDKFLAHLDDDRSMKIPTRTSLFLRSAPARVPV